MLNRPNEGSARSRFAAQTLARRPALTLLTLGIAVLLTLEALHVGHIARDAHIAVALLALIGTVALGLHTHRVPLAWAPPRLRPLVGPALNLGVFGAHVAWFAFGLGLTKGSAPDAHVWTAGMWLTGLCLLSIGLPGLSRNPATRGHARLATLWRRTLTNTTLTAVIFGALGAGLLGALGVIDELFGGVRDSVFVTTALWVTVTAFLTWMSQLVRDLEHAGDAEPVPPLWQALARRVLAPLLVVYLGILSAYELYVVTSGHMPKNMLSPLLIGSGVAGLLCAMLVELMRADADASAAPTALRTAAGVGVEVAPRPFMETLRGAMLVSRVVPVVLIVLLPLAFFALLARVEQYGWTPFRVVRMNMLLGLFTLSVWGSVRLVRQKQALFREIPLVLAGLSLVAAVGPLSARNVSLHSQTARVERMLAAHNITLPVHKALDTPITLDADAYDDLHTALEDMGRAFGADVRTQALGPAFASSSRWLNRDLRPLLGVDRARRAIETTTHNWPSAWVTLPDGTQLARPRYYRGILPGQAQLDRMDETGDVVLRLAAAGCEDQELRATLPTPADDETQSAPRLLPLLNRAGAIRGHIALTDHTYHRRGDDVPFLNMDGWTVLLKPGIAVDGPDVACAGTAP